jgi:putative membrane protein
VTDQLPSYPGPGQLPAPPEDMAEWHRLHPLSPLVRSGRHLTGLVILLVVLVGFNARKSGGDFISEGVVIAVVLVAGIISWAVTRWRVDGAVLLIETGLLRRQSLRFPLSKVQAIDVVQTGLARVFGLAQIQLRMAGADSSDARLVALRLADAQALREELLSLSHATQSPAVTSASTTTSATATAEATPTEVQAGERVLFRVQTGRLLAGLALSITGLMFAIIIAAIVVIAVLVHSPAANAYYLPFLVGVIIGVWRQFNGQYGTTVALAPDGLRLRSGLVQTTAETIRPGRVQAVRVAEPLVWRWLGWSRLEVDVAGPRQRRENRSESRRLRALVPVGSRAETEKLLGELVANPPQPTRRPPAQARWKAPLNYHFLAWDSDDRYVVASRGRVRRTTTWVPLEKVQSTRWVQGPVQRRLGLASVQLDVAGRRTSASITDRSTAEASQILARLPAQARAARLAANPQPPAATPPVNPKVPSQPSPTEPVRR